MHETSYPRYFVAAFDFVITVHPVLKTRWTTKKTK